MTRGSRKIVRKGGRSKPRQAPQVFENSWSVDKTADDDRKRGKGSGRRRAASPKGPPPLPLLKGQHDLYPPTAPGMRLPGPDFVDMAKRLGDDESEYQAKGKKQILTKPGEHLIELLRRATYSDGNFSVLTTVKGRKVLLRSVSGHKWHQAVTGPVRSDVMVIGKMLGEEEVADCRNLVGPTGNLLYELASKYATDHEIGNWYVTNLLKTSHPEGYGNSVLKMSWINEWLPVLDQELRLVRPRIIICLGADASKALLGKQATVAYMEGRVVEHSFPISRDASDDLRYHTALVMTILHPAAALKAPELEEKLENGIARAVQLSRGQRWDKEEEGLDHRLVDNVDSLRDLVAEIDADIEDNLLGVDAEWHGQHPQNKGAYLRSFQVSWRHKTGAVIPFRGQHGKKLHSKEDLQEIKRLIKKICQGRMLAGHFFDADMEFLTAFGIDLRENYRVPDTWQGYMRAVLNKEACGLDTGHAAHAVSETDDFSLTSQSLRNTTAPRYDTELSDYKKRYCSENNLKNEELEGYGPFPDEVLIGRLCDDGRLRNSYAVYDADVTRRLAKVRIPQLCRDSYGNNCWEAMWMNMRALPAVLEINTTGLMIDKDRVDQLTLTYMTARANLEQRIREWARWPDFNLNSVQQVREFLFGEKYNGKIREPGTPPIRLRPEKAKSLKLDPILSTDKRPVPWEEVRERGQEDEKTPSTDKTSLSLLAQENQSVPRWQKKKRKRVVFDFSTQVNWIRDYRFISQVLKSSLRPPLLKDDGDNKSSYRLDDSGHYVYAGGIAASICDDGRVRTHIYPTKETGRWSSARPALQNLSKRREPDYKRILGDSYSYPLRTIIMSSPGHVLVEVDFVGAELFGAAIMSGDRNMIDHSKRNQLPEDHPDFYDIHSNVAKLAFGLGCEPTKAGLYSIGQSHMRIVAKSVVFGIMYGRGAKAIALAAKEEGVIISVDEAQRVIDTVFSMYPDLRKFFDDCGKRALRERWLCGAFGRFRRFPAARDEKLHGDFERQGMNFPMQNMVADAVDHACDNLDTYRRELPEDDDFGFSIVLQIHDALLFEVLNEHVERLIDEVIPFCMVDQIPIYPCYLDGSPKHDPDAPYHFGIDVEVSHHWGEMMYPDAFLERGIDAKYGGWTEEDAGWRHVHKNTDKLWLPGGGWVEAA